jgi:hypothetical protein
MISSGKGYRAFSAIIWNYSTSRTLLHERNHQADFDEDSIWKYLALLDLEEYGLRKKQPQEAEE